MATSATSPIHLGATGRGALLPDRRFAISLVSALTVLALAIHGYHPYAEDGGLYMAGVKRLLDPRLYANGNGFVLGHLRFSLFAPMVAALVRASGGAHGQTDLQTNDSALQVVLLLLHAASVWLTLLATWLLASRCYRTRRSRAGAVTLLACWLGLPVAGTSLVLMDPYTTARSLSTPCMILALVGMFDMTGWSDREAVDGIRPGAWMRGCILCAGALGLAAVMHPLMAGYALGSVLALGCVRSPRREVRVWGTAALCLAAVALAGGVQAVAPPESLDYLRVVRTRPYWFLWTWHWYELAGLWAPLAILAGSIRAWPSPTGPNLRWSRRQGSWPMVRSGTHEDGRRSLEWMAVAVGATAWTAAAAYARMGAETHLVARLQPLRAFQIVYLVMIVALGGRLGEQMLGRSAPRWAALTVLLGGILLTAERATYPASNHLEVPWEAPRNSWVRAFLWIRHNTPRDALFALDPDYITTPNEDAQNFRALAERSALPDYSKDGGEASITPTLTEAWVRAQTAQAGLSASATTDSERRAALGPLGVDWVVLERGAVTSLECPYANVEVRVCRLR